MRETIPKLASGQVISQAHPFTGSGIQPDRAIRAAIEAEIIRADKPIEAAQIQPASLDLRLGTEAWRLRAGFLPGAGAASLFRIESKTPVFSTEQGTTIVARAKDFTMHRLDIQDGAVLEAGCVYLVKLMETLALPKDIRGRANPKSSIGRIDVLTRLVTDRASRFDTVPDGYDGPLYAEISPRTFPILVRPGDRLNQLRFFSGKTESVRVQELSLDLHPNDTGICGYRARRHAGLIDLGKLASYAPGQYWEQVRAPEGYIVLDPEEFYILASQEEVRIRTDQAAEMLPVAPELGEFRVHYAGFFDPGFGLNKKGSKAVLEVRPRDVPFILEHGQIVAQLEYRPMAAEPHNRYGQGRKAEPSNYQGQGLRLSKYFRQGV